jgi:lysophospholipase L1-like esterase
MTKRTFLKLAAVLLSAGLAAAQSPQKWVATWAASPVATNVPTAPAKPVADGAPAAAPAKPQPIRSFNNQTIRMVVNTSIPGRMVRVELSNHFGAAPLKIGAARLALHDKDGAIVPASDRVLTFSGSPTALIPRGASMISDAVDLAVPAIGDLVVSVYLPEDTGPPTQHPTGLHTTYISGPGDFTAQTSFTAERTTNSWYFLSGVHVLAPADTKLVVAFGDSITDGATSTNNANADWPSQLAKRLHATGMNVAVVNQGISGNRVLADGAGVSVLARFERDVLSQPGVTHLIFMEAINDIGSIARGGGGVSAEAIIAIYKQMIDRAHMHGIRVIGATLTPYEGAGYFSENGEAMRTAVNDWIRTTGLLDGVVDFDAATRDPANPRRFLRSYTNTDFLHPNDAGYKAIADVIDLYLFK